MISGVSCPDPTPGAVSLHRTSLTWLAPSSVTPFQYIVTRSGAPAPIATVATPPATPIVDPTELPNGVSFTYTNIGGLRL